MSQCPYSKFECDANCGKWVTLTQNMSDKTVKETGRCADAWMPILMIELKQAILNIDTQVRHIYSEVKTKALNI